MKHAQLTGVYASQITALHSRQPADDLQQAASNNHKQHKAAGRPPCWPLGWQGTGHRSLIATVVLWHGQSTLDLSLGGLTEQLTLSQGRELCLIAHAPAHHRTTSSCLLVSLSSTELTQSTFPLHTSTATFCYWNFNKPADLQVSYSCKKNNSAWNELKFCYLDHY